MHLLEEMTHITHPPNLITYNTVLDCLSKNGEVNCAIDMLYSMTEKGCTPDLSSYNTVMYGLIKEERFEEAFRMFCQMKKILALDYTTLCTILPSFVKNGLMKEALHTVEEYILKADCNTDKSSFHSLMEGILKKAGVEKSRVC